MSSNVIYNYVFHVGPRPEEIKPTQKPEFSTSLLSRPNACNLQLVTPLELHREVQSNVFIMTENQLTCSAVAIKVPEFMETAVSGWFAIIEAQFHLRNVTDQTTKYYHVISRFPPDIVAKLSPSILTAQKYD